MESAFIFCNVILVLLAMAILSGRSAWKSVLLLLAASGIFSLLLLMIGQQFLAIIILIGGILGCFSLFVLAVRTNRNRRQPVPFKRYNRFISVVAVAGLLLVTLYGITKQLSIPAPLPQDLSMAPDLGSSFNDWWIWLSLVAVLLMSTLIGLSQTYHSED